MPEPDATTLNVTGDPTGALSLDGCVEMLGPEGRTGARIAKGPHSIGYCWKSTGHACRPICAAALGVKVNEVPALTLSDAPEVAVLTPESATLSIRQPTDASVCG